MDCAFSSLRAYRGKSEIARLFVTFHTIIEVRNLNGKREELEELCQCYVVVNASAALPARILRVLSVDPSRRRLPTQCIFLFFTQFTSRIKQSSVLRLESPRSGQAKQCCSVHTVVAASWALFALPHLFNGTNLAPFRRLTVYPVPTL